MRRRAFGNLDLSTLVDVVSNVAGMMILLACVALLVRDRKSGAARAATDAKPINYPMAYLPVEKQSVYLCLKYGQLFELPERELLEALTEKTITGSPVTWLELSKGGVDSRLDLTPTATGYRFQFRITQQGGIALSDQGKLTKTLDEIVKRYPADRFFIVIHSWADEFATFREIRQYLIEKGIEVGWTPRGVDAPERDVYDIVYASGQYSAGYTYIKAQ